MDAAVISNGSRPLQGIDSRSMILMLTTNRTTAADDPPPSDDASSPTSLPAARFAWVELIPWGIMFGLGWLIVELTAKPIFGIAVACLKFCWKDFVIAFWLYEEDPWKRRGGVHALSFVSKAAFRFGLMTTLATYLVDVFQDRPQKDFDGELRVVTQFAFGICGIVASMFLGIAAILGAYGSRTWIWLDSSIDDSRRQRRWPPRPSARNRAVWMVAVSAFFPGAVASIATWEWTRSDTLAAWAALIVGTLWAMIGSRAVASSPARAWPELLLDSDPVRGSWLEQFLKSRAASMEATSND